MEQQIRKVPWKVVIPVSIVVILILLIFLFRVTKVTVEGNTFFSEEVVASEVCNTFWDKNTISAFVKNHLGFSAELPYVREYEITYPGMNHIHIKLYEKKIVAGIAYMSQYVYFDKDGTVLKSTNEKLPDIPLFETKTMTTFTLYETVQMEDEDLLAQIMNLSQLFQHYEVTWDSVVFDRKNAAYLYTGDIRVSLGKKSAYDEEIAALSSVLKTALEKNLSGEIDMTNHHFGGDIILKKNK
nr:hypothetical protein [Eubacterium sp.]